VGSQATKKTIVAIIVLGTAAVYFVYQAAQSSWAYYYSVDEFVADSAFRTGGQNDSGIGGSRTRRVIRLAGRVKPGSVVQDTDKGIVRFELAGQKHSLAIRCSGSVPANFAPGKEVVVEGRLDAGGMFQAERILTRCESKYKVRIGDSSYESCGSNGE